MDEFLPKVLLVMAGTQDLVYVCLAPYAQATIPTFVVRDDYLPDKNISVRISVD